MELRRAVGSMVPVDPRADFSDSLESVEPTVVTSARGGREPRSSQWVGTVLVWALRPDGIP